MKRMLALLTVLTFTASSCLYADNSVTINNNYAPPSGNDQSQPTCNNNQQSNNGQPPGTYYQTNPHGGTDTVYSTGDKQPYIVDNNCNNQQPLVIAPNVYPQNNPRPPIKR